MIITQCFVGYMNKKSYNSKYFVISPKIKLNKNDIFNFKIISIKFDYKALLACEIKLNLFFFSFYLTKKCKVNYNW